MYAARTPAYRVMMLAVLFLASCQPAPTPSPASLPGTTLIQVQLTPTLRALAPTLNACIRQVPGAGLTIFERPASAIDLNFPGIMLRWGAPARLPGSAVVVSSDTLVLAVHPDNPLQSLTRAQIQAVYSGAASGWKDLLQPTCKSCSPDSATRPFSGQPIHAYAYNPGDDIEMVFTAALGQPVKPGLTYLAPDPEAMRQAIASDPDAIGFLPGRYVDASVKGLKLEDISLESLVQPILALSSSEPQGLSRQWLGCVQQALK